MTSRDKIEASLNPVLVQPDERAVIAPEPYLTAADKLAEARDCDRAMRRAQRELHRAEAEVERMRTDEGVDSGGHLVFEAERAYDDARKERAASVLAVHLDPAARSLARLSWTASEFARSEAIARTEAHRRFGPERAERAFPDVNILRPSGRSMLTLVAAQGLA